MTLEEQLGSILKTLKNTVANIKEIENTVNSRAGDVNTVSTDVQAKAEEMKKYVDTMNSSINTLNTLEQQITDMKSTITSTTDRAEKMLKETQAIRDTLTDALVWKGSVDNYAALPTENVKVGDTYNITAADSAHRINAGDNVVWDGTKWDSMGGIMNVDSLAVKGQDADFKEVTATTFHGALNGKADSATTADVAKTVAWDSIGGKPATFPSDIQFDDVPTAGSMNSVTSDGIKKAIDAKTVDLSNYPTKDGTGATGNWNINTATATKATQDASGNVITTTYATKTELATKQDKLTFDTTPTADSTNPVTSAGIKAAIDAKMVDLSGYQTKLTFDTAPTEGSANPVTSDGVQKAIAAADVMTGCTDDSITALWGVTVEDGDQKTY